MPSQQVQDKTPTKLKILILNPNSSQAMTEGMTEVLAHSAADLGLSSEIHSYTAPMGSGAPASIDDGGDMAASAAAVLADPALRPGAYDAVLVACFSVHPLVRALQAPDPRDPHSPSHSRNPRAVIGIFEASILAALALLRPPPPPPSSAGASPRDGEEEEEEEEGPEMWGIVTTGKFWEAHLTAGVHAFLGTTPNTSPPNTRFAGVESTGLNASDFHSGVPASVVRAKLGEATRRLLQRGGGRTTVIVMGCAGMAGLEEIIRGAAVAELGERFAHDVLHVVDGVRAGVVEVEGMVKHLRLRGRRRG